LSGQLLDTVRGGGKMRTTAAGRTSRVLLAIAFTGAGLWVHAGAASAAGAARGIRASVPAALASRAGDIAELRTRTSQTFPAAGGSREIRVAQQSLNYRDAQGRWQPIDNTLRRDGDVVRNGANRYGLSVPATLGGGDVKVSNGDAWIGLAPRGAGASSKAAGASVRFANAWPGVELRYTATGDTVREALVMRTRGSVRDFSFNLHLPLGYRAQQDASGAVVIRDDKGARRFALTPSTLVDAQGMSTHTRSTLTRTLGGWVLTIEPDRAWLDQPERAWPVTVDPTITLGGDLACSIVFDEQVGNSASCGDPLPVGEACIDLCKYNRVLAKFDLTDALPAGGVVEFAGLDLQADPPDVGIEARRVTAPWNANVDWYTRDGTTPWSSSPSWPDGGALGDSVDITDFTALVKDWISGAVPNYGVLLLEGRDTFDLTYVNPELSIQYSLTDIDGGALDNVATGEYTSTDGISAAEARRRLKIQARLSNLADDLTDAIDEDDFGGIWFDDASGGRIKIGIKTNQQTPPHSKTADAEDLLDDHNLLDDSDFVAVQFTAGQLDDASDDLADQFGTLLAADKLHVGVDVSRNAVIVEKANSLTPAETSSLNTAVASEPVTVIVELTDDVTLGAELQTCGRTEPPFSGWTSPPHPQIVEDDMRAAIIGCDDPFRAGVGLLGWGMEDGHLRGSLCTAGFLTHHNPNDGFYYILTAGHCMREGIQNPPSVWKSYDSNHNQINIGDPAAFGRVPIDAGIVKVDASSIFAQGATPLWVYVEDSEHTTYSETYPIHDVPVVTQHLVGTRACWTGAVRISTENAGHTNCGKVSQVHDHSLGSSSLIQVNNCSPGGSSGGPLYRSFHAYGILVSGRRKGKIGVPCRTWFTEVRVAMNRLHVQIEP
jgi:hypothetical protein